MRCADPIYITGEIGQTGLDQANNVLIFAIQPTKMSSIMAQNFYNILLSQFITRQAYFFNQKNFCIKKFKLCSILIITFEIIYKLYIIFLLSNTPYEESNSFSNLNKYLVNTIVIGLVGFILVTFICVIPISVMNIAISIVEKAE